MQPKLKRLAAFIVAAIVSSAPAVAAADDAAISPEQQAFFETRIRPLLVARCLECHGAEKQKGGLRLDSRAGWQTGGDSGPAIVPGKPEDSLLVAAVRRESLEMPPSGKLPDAEIAAFEEWVRIGAPDPRTGDAVKKTTAIDPEQARTHWAFQPLVAQAAPPIRDAAWPRTDVDRFILAKLEARGLHPGPEADRYALLRRLSLDLTGLPPTPEEIAAFLADASPAAYEAAVDRLLASPAFGEKWARHWLDLVGYADQIGTANNIYAEHAWRYRDYVIAAFNADKPFDQFIREQIAGDLLSASRPEERAAQITATGFLILGNVDVVQFDKDQLKADVVDQQIEKVGKAFLGQTLNCARCHDHKFDPLTLGDYYGLAGIFNSTESVYLLGRGVWSGVLASELPETPEQTSERQRLARENAERIASMKNDQAAAAKRRDAVDLLLKTPPATDDGQATQMALEKERASLEGRLKDLDGRIRHAEFFAPAPPLAYAVREGKSPGDARITIRGNPHVLGDSVSRGFVQVAFHGTPPAIPQSQSGRLQLADWLASEHNPLTARVAVNRIWQKLFGEGLVRSVDYFGLRGETPSHPDLLDHLAARFVREGWSQKQLIRELATSSVYRLSVASDAAAEQADPDNRLLARMNRVRLDAESLRDSLLAASGDLLPTAGGPSLPLEFLENVGIPTPQDPNPAWFRLSRFRPEQARLRTVYLPVVRSSAQQGPSDILNFFDFTQPAQFAGQRPATSVPTQALFLLNSPLVKEQSRKLAESLLAAPAPDDRARLAALWLRVLNRPPTAAEVEKAAALLAASNESGAAKEEATRTAWARLCQALLISNEFLFRS